MTLIENPLLLLFNLSPFIYWCYSCQSATYMQLKDKHLNCLSLRHSCSHSGRLLTVSNLLMYWFRSLVLLLTYINKQEYCHMSSKFSSNYLSETIPTSSNSWITPCSPASSYNGGHWSVVIRIPVISSTYTTCWIVRP